MRDPPPKPGILGLTGYLLGGLTVAVAHLFAALALGLDAVHDAAGSALTLAVRDGTLLTFTLITYFTILPLFVVGVAALVGRHGAHTGQAATGAAALTTLVGIPLVWVNLAIAALLAAAIQGAQGLDTAFDHAVEVLLSSAIALLAALGPLVGLGALIANRAHAWSRATAHGHAHHHHHHDHSEHEPEEATGPGAQETPPYDYEEPEPLPEPEPEAPMHSEAEAWTEEALQDHPVHCPRCGHTFSVTGARPLRIACPACGKTGTIR